MGDEVSPAQPVALVLSLPVAPACHHPPFTQPGCWEPRGKPEREQAGRGARSDAGGLGKQIEVGDGKSPFPLVSPVPPGFVPLCSKAWPGWGISKLPLLSGSHGEPSSP